MTHAVDLCGSINCGTRIFVRVHQSNNCETLVAVVLSIRNLEEGAAAAVVVSLGRGDANVETRKTSPAGAVQLCAIQGPCMDWRDLRPPSYTSSTLLGAQCRLDKPASIYYV